ncbi:uncharacterized protein LOC120924156 isoform X2 [Rana temporaria]|uniref:uncharacterized protein LOC120924156 isoform X2 n=1 Tax=Rana temporaria TaxID=8407 RepID=UPI001AAD0471|nr:uncharacterized protein LOC120924156 isoform X2 [Rana temporaria]
MTPLIFLVMLVPRASWTTGGGGLETPHLYAEIGSSVSFPGVKIDNYTVYDLSGANGAVVVACHGGCKVRDPYTQRGHFYQHNGTFLLTRLRKEDSGIFEYTVNFTSKGQIHLWVMAPVMDPILEQEARENGTRCSVTVTCQAKGDGPLSFTILRNDKILHNVTVTDDSASLSVDGRDPEMSGIFSCVVRNAVSSETSPSIVFLPPVKPWQTEMVLVAIGLFLQWGVTMLYSLLEICLPKCRKSNRGQFRQMNGNKDEVVQDSGTPSLCSEVLTTADNLLGFIKESLAVAISVFGCIIPWWCWVIPAFFFLCRTMHWIIQLVNRCRKTREKISFFFVKVFCAVAIGISSVLGVPTFCIAVLVIFYLHHSCPCPCGMTSKWPLYVSIVPIAFVILCIISYLYVKQKAKAKRKKQSQPEDVKTQLQTVFTSNFPDGGQPEENGNPDCEEREPGVIVAIPNGDVENPEQGASCENSTEEAPEDHLIPKPKEGQSQGSVEIPCKSHLGEAPNHEDPDGTEDTEGQCLLTVPSEVVALDKDRVANG